MGNEISTAKPPSGLDSYVEELGDIHYERSLGNARFMKTIRGRHKDSLVVAKIYIKREGTNFPLMAYTEKATQQYHALLDVPNAFAFQWVLHTQRAVYLVRQYIYSSLYDRISTRPFLTAIEKKWIAYQLLRGVADAHARKIYHGDIKTENVLATSWNWVYLVDFSPYKPVFLPEDNPADFSFFFDMSSRRSCYIAPERFYKSGSDIDQKMKSFKWGDPVEGLTDKMDIFSVGCVIAELFLEGTALFSLSQLLKYRSEEYSPETSLEKIEDEHIRDLIRHMIQLDPKRRLTAESYLTEWRGKSFPDYFYTFLHQYISSVTDKTENLAQIQQTKTDTKTQMSSNPSAAAVAASELRSLAKKLTDADDKIERIYHDFDKIAYSYNEDAPSHGGDQTPRSALGERRRTLSDLPNTTASAIILPPTLSIPNYEPDGSSSGTSSQKTGEQGSLIFLSFVCSLIRNASFPSSKLKALDILLALGEHLSDDVKLDRLLPYLMALLSDQSALVRANAIKTLTQVLCMVESISPINARVFPEYILPSLRDFATDPDVLVRTTYASCIALLAETALRFLEMTQLLKNDSALPSTDQEADELDFESTYDSSLNDLKAVIQEQVTTLLIDPESSVKRALLTNITCLCVFFGRQKANDVLLSHMITYLNDKDWMLRSAFFESIKGVGTFVGALSLEEYILPLMVQALTDAEEFVVEKVLNSLASLADLDLFPKMKLWELVGIIAPLLCHPSTWIRYGSIGFISSAAKHMPQTDLWCIIYPLLMPFLKSDIAEINEQCLLENLKAPLPRPIYEQATVWATRASSESAFWKSQQEKKRKPGGAASRSQPVGLASLVRQGSLFNSFMVEEQFTRSSEDEAFMERLRNMGMSEEDEEKLLFMREYLYKVSRAKIDRPKNTEHIKLEKGGEIYLKNLGITPVTVFLRELSKGQSLVEQQPDSRPLYQQTDGAERRPKAMQTKPKEDVCKLNRVASEPHVQAILPSLAGDQVDLQKGHQKRPASISAGSAQRSVITASPMASPTDYSFPMPPVESKSSKAKRALTDQPTRTELKHLGIQQTTRPDENAGMQSIMAKSAVGYGHLQNLLVKVAREAFPPESPEFAGDPAVMKRLRRLPQGVSARRTISNWRPDGSLVAHFTEHTAGINQLAISWDSLLFASCSDDGSVKIWDCSRLERNVTNRSRATYNQQGGRLKCITFIQQTYSIAAASDNGSIHIFRVDIRAAGQTVKFGKCITVRKYQLDNEYAVSLQHFTSNASNTMTGSKSILLFATTKGNIYAMDIMTMKVLWKLQNPPSHGLITSMVTDRRHTWLLVGTTRGILTFYDLRFQIALRSWMHYTKSRISAMILNNDPAAEGKQVLIAAGRNEVTLWNIVTLKCLQVFCVKSGEERTTGVNLETYKPLETPSDQDILMTSYTDQEANLTENSIRAMVSPMDCQFLVTGGTDRKLRFWDTGRTENSCVVLGLETDELKPRYSTTMIDQVQFHFEFAPRSPTNASHRGLGRSGGGQQGSSVAQQQYLMRNHTDAITDVVLTEIPYPMLISGDRDGVIKVVS
ncbi:hypothetical protein BCR43DRAFT_483381 [Syncephalastrum racemosum]|uniref:non-specific serine/threonine protein kinase n=1 Tax=Syncephalastrum racemosum TaxID=13706 RepID=A0A1X2HV56_SYNRA|nr:hypothetical protein BCR43DRAFT_483381 [Syncephalastrum racemosum]